MPADLDITAISAAANDTIDKAAAEISQRIGAELELRARLISNSAARSGRSFSQSMLEQRIATLLCNRLEYVPHPRVLDKLTVDIIDMVRNASIK